MIRKLITAAALTMAFAVPAIAAEPIVGNWTTEAGDTANIAPCGGGFCIVLKSGEYAGKSIGKVSGSGNRYRGTVTKPSTGKTYSGSAQINGNSMRMKGCVAAVLCDSQTWKRQ